MVSAHGGCRGGVGGLRRGAGEGCCEGFLRVAGGHTRPRYTPVCVVQHIAQVVAAQRMRAGYPVPESIRRRLWDEVTGVSPRWQGGAPGGNERTS